MQRIDVKILGGGQNWIGLGGKIALGLDGYYSRLPKGSTVSVTTADPGMLCLEGVKWVAEGRFHIGITTPGWFVKLAVEGKAPFDQPLPLKMLAIFPHDDRMAFAVRRETGIRTFHDLKERKYPLKVSTLPRTTWHPALWGTEVILAEYGITLDDFVEWGGTLLGDRPRFINAPGVKPATEGFDAVFDEAVMTRRWKNLTEQHDITFLPVDDEVLTRLERKGWKRGKIAKGRFRGVDADVPAADFSGWALYCRADIEDELAYLTIAAIDEQKTAIEELFPQPHGALTGPVDMRSIGRDMPVPLHPGAERYYREKGYL
jgi:TRAP transporter TAXI family solute receptor